MGKSDFGLIGLAVMGQNLVLNVESRGYSVSVYNRTTSIMREFVERHSDRKLAGFSSIEEFVSSLERPRKIMILVKSSAGADINERDAVDGVIESLVPLLDEGDLLIDGGNTYYIHTERRWKDLASKGIRFIGTGVSGGEEGARKGPSIMPGGTPAGWEMIRPIFEAISAKAGADGDEPCVAHIGEGGAGHYVKMVHNGIEYGDMQLICEAYQIFAAAGFSSAELAEVFRLWNTGELESYLVQITSEIFCQTDPETGQPIVDLIVDKAGQKGTGRWTVLNAVDNAVVVSTINAAVEARTLSSQKAERVAASTKLQGPTAAIGMPRDELVAKVHDALYASKIVSYAQGLSLIMRAGEVNGWNLDLGAIARIWRGGCIIRARFLNRIAEAYERDAGLTNLMLDPFFAKILNRSQESWREAVALAVANGIPVPAFGASLAYYDSYRSARLPANLLQAQRDFFGAHTYERVDRPEGVFFHTDWPEVIS
jgi:6-phosphogluconate dehydrogenase